MDIISVRFVIERTGDGSYVATCPELGSRVEAETLPLLETKLAQVAKSLLAVPGAASPLVLVRRVFPSTRATA